MGVVGDPSDNNSLYIVIIFYKTRFAVFVVPVTCVDEEWVHFISKPKGSKNKMLFFYYCADADANLKTKCTKYLARCLYDTPYISRNDVLACKKLFYKYNLGQLPAEDLGSAYNGKRLS